MSKKKNFGKINGREAMVVGIIIVMVALFSILSPTFRTYSTFVSVLDMSYYIALMAIGVTFTLITGGVDLSIGTGLICYSLFGGYLIVHKDVPVVVALIACLVLSILIGALNGFLVAIMDLPPFLATLCTCMITRGLGSLLSGGFGVSWPSSLEPEGWFRKIFRFTVNGKVIPIAIPQNARTGAQITVESHLGRGARWSYWNQDTSPCLPLGAILYWLADFLAGNERRALQSDPQAAALAAQWLTKDTAVFFCPSPALTVSSAACHTAPAARRARPAPVPAARSKSWQSVLAAMAAV